MLDAIHGQLPEYYVSTQKAKDLGWEKRKCNLSAVAPGKMIGGGVFNNFNNKLPDTSERIWYEADINYEQGCRNASRLVYSNDGLIFVTYDHYQTFQEIVD